MKTSERFQTAGCSTDSFSATIGAVTKSGSWYTFVANVITKANRIEPFICKVNAGSKDADYVAKVEEFFAGFKAGDYILSNVSIREKGETWHDEANATEGVYKESYISVPYISNILALGNGAIMNTKKDEAKLARMALLTAQDIEE